MNDEMFALRLDPALRRRINDAARRRRCSAAQVVRSAIELHLKEGANGDRRAAFAEAAKYLDPHLRG